MLLLLWAVGAILTGYYGIWLFLKVDDLVLYELILIIITAALWPLYWLVRAFIFIKDGNRLTIPEGVTRILDIPVIRKGKRK